MENFKITLLLLLSLFATSQAIHVAVLETAADPGVKNIVSLTDRQYLTNVLREQAVKELPASQNFTIMTRENITAMLPPDKSIEECEGSCIVETGKNIAADYICQARVSSFNGSLTLSAELYETAGNKLIASFNGLGPNQSSLLTLIIQKSPEFFRSIKKDLGKNAPTAAPQTSPTNNEVSYTTSNPPQSKAPNAGYEYASSTGYEYYTPTAKQNTPKEEKPWPRVRFFIHAGILDAGLGLKLRLSHQNGIYITADTRWLSFKNDWFVQIPMLIYLGGNHVHFITGVSVMATSNTDGPDDAQIPLGLNVDIGRHFGIDALVFAGSHSSLTLDFRIVF